MALTLCLVLMLSALAASSSDSQAAATAAAAAAAAAAAGGRSGRAAATPGAKSRQMCKTYGESVVAARCAAVEPPLSAGTAAHPGRSLQAETREFPHMALIGYGEKNAIKWLCGGSLVSERYVLSAAICSDPKGSKLGAARWVKLGEYNQNSDEDDTTGLAQPEVYEIVERHPHPDFKSPSVYHDIALFKLNKDVKFTEFIRPICLNSEPQIKESYAIATGWGRRGGKGGGLSDVLTKLNLTISNSINKQCSDFYKSRKSILAEGIKDDILFCAKGGEGDTCQGDSGGPLQVRLADPPCMYKQLGIISFGVACDGHEPGGYTRVSHYVPWIESIVWP